MEVGGWSDLARGQRRSVDQRAGAGCAEDPPDRRGAHTEAESFPMMASISELIGTQPILALFLAIGLGYAVGQINILGFSLGVGAVLFVGLFIGAIAPKAQVAGPLGLVGLI